MPRYRVYLHTTASASIEVEAMDAEEAIDKAYEEAPSGLCAYCSGLGGRPGIDLSGVWELDDDGVEEISA